MIQCVDPLGSLLCLVKIICNSCKRHWERELRKEMWRRMECQSSFHIELVSCQRLPYITAFLGTPSPDARRKLTSSRSVQMAKQPLFATNQPRRMWTHIMAAREAVNLRLIQAALERQTAQETELERPPAGSSAFPISDGYGAGHVCLAA